MMQMDENNNINNERDNHNEIYDYIESDSSHKSNRKC